MAEKVEILEIETGNSEQTIRELKDQIKALRSELEGCTIGSDKFKDTLDELTTAQDKLKNATKKSNEALEGSYDALVAKMSELKKAWRATADEAERADLGQQISDINNQLKDMDASIGSYQRNVGNYASAFDNVTMKIEGGVAKFERFNNVTRSVIGSFDLVEGGLKAIGVESEEVNGLMDKMQGAMQITAGLTSVKEGVQAFNMMRIAIQSSTVAQKILNGVMAANPIGAVVVAVTTLVAGVAAFVKKMKESKAAIERVNAAMEAYNLKTKERVRDQELEIELMEAREAKEEDILARRLEHANKNEKEARETLRKIQQEYNAASKKDKEKMQEDLDEAQAAWEDAVETMRDIQDEQQVYTEKKRHEDKVRYQEYLKEIAEIRRQAEIQEWNEKEARELAKIEADKARREQEKQKIIADYKDLMEQLRLSQLSEYERELDAAEDQFLQMQDILQRTLDLKLITMEEFLDTLAIIEGEYAAKIDEIDAREADREDPLTKTQETTEAQKTLGDVLKKNLKLTDQQFNNISAGVGLVGTAFGQTSQLLNTLSQQQDKTSEEGFEAAKKMSIGAAVMSMLQGIISSWTSAMSLPAPISFITGGLMSAFTATMGGIQIDQIKKQTFQNADKGTSSKASVAPPAINTAALISSPISYMTEVKGAQTDEMIPQKVYVVESDITSTQNKVKTIEEESTF